MNVSLFYTFLFLLFLVTEDDDLNPVCLFKFIINPHSFGQTIENLFHLSFLVRVSCTPLRKKNNILDLNEIYRVHTTHCIFGILLVSLPREPLKSS